MFKDKVIEHAHQAAEAAAACIAKVAFTPMELIALICVLLVAGFVTGFLIGRNTK